MPAIEPELQALRENLNDMLSMVKNQLEKCIEAIEKQDSDIAQKVLDDERKINIQELSIDRDCENILALFTPVATDLRSVLAALKITNDLERIGDSAKSLAKVLLDGAGKKNYRWMEALKIVPMLEELVSMLKDMGNAMRKEDTKPALKAVKKDEVVNDYYKKAVKTTADLILKNPDDGKSILILFLMVRNLERSGDLTKNIAEEIVFQIEARVLKHKGKKK
ncbi:MAG TPA: phosphate signaling complex protein PhoU [Chryseosolibacter sp.]|nr:phosphate signaling complex protein PhoU [Chryseosolibacter sp.]